MKMKVHISQLRLKRPEKTVQKKTSVRTSGSAMNRDVHLECDIRGMMVDEAIPVVDRYLDECVLSGLHEVSVIHGKGTGALRTGIQQHLHRHPYVKSYRIGAYGEGDAGVTVVTLK